MHTSDQAKGMRELPFDLGGVLFVDCGAVGKPKDGDARAAFAILREAKEESMCRLSEFRTTPCPSRGR